ncbi:A-kinase anchor protein 1, mitochondrial isoform X4 [Oncorhynchus kisutch]|uniref:A-kinase anchor protein 1, mitochondrial isoform X4 n=1 Tax=Oncorhynchus kisutch TaxID=8019 RepID=UPI0012DC9751|nr:A-kinase anchor protein 1, mitochondrial isoform X4 [Oncorhynchus kisutch]
MVQRLQSVLTLYLSGVLAFLGLWWYIYRKKEYHLTDKDDANDETTADQEHLSSPRDVGNCVVENGHSTGMHLDGHAVRERSLVEQELVDITNTAAAEQGIVPLCQSQPEVRVVAADGLISSLVTAAVKPVYESTESSAQVFLETAAQGGPKQDLELQWEHQPCVPSAMRATSHESTCSLSICDLGSGKSKSVGESAGLNQPPQSETLEDITNSTLNLEPTGELVRLEPAGEVVRLEPAGGEVVRLEPAGGEVVRLEPAGGEVVRLEPAGGEVVRLEPAGGEVVRLEPAGGEVVRLEPAGGEVVRLEPAGGEVEKIRLELAVEVEKVRLEEEVVRLEPAEEEVRLEPAEEEVRLEPAEEEVRLEPAEEEVRLEPAEEEVRLEPAEEEVRLEPAEEEVRLEPAEEEVRLEPAEEEVRLEPAEEEVRLEPAEEEVRLEPAEEEVRLEPAEEEVRLEPAEEEVRLEPAEEEVRLEPAEEEVRLEPAEEEVRLEPAEEVEEVRLEPAEEVEMVRRDPAEEVEMVRREPAEEEEVVRLEPEGDILSAVEEPTFESSLQADTCLASPSHLITSRVSASKQPLGMLRLPQKKESEECKLSRSNTAEINQLVSGLITDVVSAAVNQFLKEKTQLGHSVSPLRSGDPCKAPDHISMDNSEPEHEMPPLFQEDPCSTTGRENISSSPIVQEDVKHDHSSRAEIETEKIEPAEDSAVGDFGSSARQTEKVSSGKELSTSMSPQPPRGPAEELGATSMFLTNGWWMANVTGSGVNSMDCVDGYCQHEARDIKHSSPSLPSQLLNTNQAIEKYNQSHNSSQSPTVWEIEVPKHFVGRLIGKKGRHVNYLKETSGAKVFITVLPYTQEFQICHIEGSEEQVDCALELIRKKFKDLDVTNCYVQPPVASLPSLSITSWLLLPHRVTVEVTVIQVASGNCVFLQQHKHPTFHAFCSLDQNMSLCYSHPGCPPLPAPVEVGVICAAQMPEGSWWRAQVMGHHEETMVELRYVDYGGYDIVKMDTLRQIRSDFVALPFQGSEVILENIAPIPDFSAAAKSALEEMTRGLALLAQVTNCHTSGIPLVQIWRTEGEELVSVNRAMVDNGLCTWVDSP